MDLIKKYKVVIAVILPILILVIIRSFGASHFKSDANRWAEPSVLRSNIISMDQAVKLPGNKLIINLGKKDDEKTGIANSEINISADSIFSKDILTSIRKHDGPVLLFFSETAVLARIWMVLSQMGYKDIYILTTEADNEVLKNEFRPDTVVRPEI